MKTQRIMTRPLRILHPAIAGQMGALLRRIVCAQRGFRDREVRRGQQRFVERFGAAVGAGERLALIGDPEADDIGVAGLEKAHKGQRLAHGFLEGAARGDGFGQQRAEALRPEADGLAREPGGRGAGGRARALQCRGPFAGAQLRAIEIGRVEPRNHIVIGVARQKRAAGIRHIAQLVRIDGDGIGFCDGAQGGRAFGRERILRRSAEQAAEKTAIGRIDMMPDAPAAICLPIFQQRVQAMDRIDLAGLGRAGDADRHQDGAGFGLRLQRQAFEIGEVEAAGLVERDAPEQFFTQAENVGGLAPGIMLVAGHQHDRPQIIAPRCVADAAIDVGRIAGRGAAALERVVAELVLAPQFAKPRPAHMGGGEDVEPGARGFGDIERQRQPVIEAIARAPHALEIGQRAAAGEMALRHVRIEAEHLRQHGDGLGFDDRADLARLLRGDVRVVQHGREPAEQGRQRQLRLHVADIARGVGGDLGGQRIAEFAETLGQQFALGQKGGGAALGRGEGERIVLELVLAPIEPVIEHRLEFGADPGFVFGMRPGKPGAGGERLG